MSTSSWLPVAQHTPAPPVQLPFAANLFRDLPDPKYRAAAGTNWSMLKEMDKSGQAYRYLQTHEREDTRAMGFGRAFHLRMLEEEKYRDRTVVFEGKSRRGKAWEAFVEEHPDVPIVLESEREQLEEMASSLEQHEDAWQLTRTIPGLNEHAAFWVEDGREMKAKIDRLGWAPEAVYDPLAPLWVIDLKTTALPLKDVDRTIERFNYFPQLEHYSIGVEMLTGRPTVAVLIFIEKQAPFDVAALYTPPDVRRKARAYRASLLKKLTDCQQRGTWPGTYPKLAEAPLPRWSRLNKF